MDFVVPANAGIQTTRVGGRDPGVRRDDDRSGSEAAMESGAAKPCQPAGMAIYSNTYHPTAPVYQALKVHTPHYLEG
jgi:hypothetical protein